MSFAFVCAKEGDYAYPETPHVTTGVLSRCAYCQKNAVAGYWCDTCGHEDTDPAEAIVGHGPGKCVAALADPGRPAADPVDGSRSFCEPCAMGYSCPQHDPRPCCESGEATGGDTHAANCPVPSITIEADYLRSKRYRGEAS